MIDKGGFVYSIKESFFQKINSDLLVKNTECCNERPHYFYIKAPDSSLLWMIPLSSKIDKYKAIYDKDLINRGKCIKIVLGRFAGKSAAFLLQDMFPIHEAYLSSAYTVKNNQVPVHTAIQKEINKSFQAIMELQKNGLDILFPDVSRIKVLMIEELKRDRISRAPKKEIEQER